MLRTLRFTPSLMRAVHCGQPAAHYPLPARFYSTVADKVFHAQSGAEYDEALKTKDQLVVVDFGAEWCPPCKAIKPKFAEFSNKYNAKFVAVDVDKVTDHPEVARIAGVPTFKFYKNGSLLKEFSGADVKLLQSTIEANL